MYTPWMGLYSSHRDTVALHFCDVTLTAKRPLERAYPRELVTVGDHTKKRRLDLKLLQKDVARMLGVDTNTVTNWEKNRCNPKLHLIPKLFKFLGHDPSGKQPKTLGERALQYRKTCGMSQKELAGLIGIDPTTLSRIEQGKRRCFKSVHRKVSEFLDHPCETKEPDTFTSGSDQQ